MVYHLEGHEDGVNCLAVSSDDSVLVSGSDNGWLGFSDGNPPYTPRSWQHEHNRKLGDNNVDVIVGVDRGGVVIIPTLSSRGIE